MIWYQGPSKALGLRFISDTGKPFNKIRAIGIRTKDLPAFNPSHNYVMHRPWCINSGFPWHD
jgi:hypothetical protein